MIRNKVLKRVAKKLPGVPKAVSDELGAALAQHLGARTTARKAASSHTADPPAQVKRVYIVPSPRPSPPAHSPCDPDDALSKQDIPPPDSNREESASRLQQTVQVPQEDLVRLFQRQYRSFRQELFLQCDGRCEAIIRRAEQRVRFLDPDFDLQSLTPATAPGILDLLPAIVSEAPFLKRSRLRASVGLLVADLYSKHYDTLEAQNLIDKVEQLYHRFKH